MIDLHSHLLPGVDDGSRTLEQSTATLERLQGDGYEGIVLTPHLMASRLARGLPPAFDEAFDRLLQKAPPALTLYRGVELMLDVELNALPRRELFTLAESRYLLVEFPPGVLDGAAAALLSGLIGLGVVPLVAHPERYAVCSEETVAGWRAIGARIQCDATTVTRDSSRGKRARALLRAGLVDLLAADNHGDGRTLRVVCDFLSRRGATGDAEILTEVNPRAVVRDAPLMPAPSVVLRRRWSEKIAGWLSGG